MKYKLVTTDGEEVQIGTRLTTFRKEIVVVKSIALPYKPGSEGRITVETVEEGIEREFYPSVCSCKWEMTE